MKILSDFLRSARGWIRLAAVTLLLFVGVRGFVLEAFTIPTSSMEPTLQVGDFLFVNRAIFGGEIPGTGLRLPGFRHPRRGEVVVFRPPHDLRRVYVKRVVGIPGDTLEMRSKRLFRNGVAVDEPYARHLDEGGDAIHPGMGWQSDFLVAATPGPRHRYVPSRDTWGPLVVPPDRFFVLGDNRDNSEDSRYWGFIRRSEVRGRPWLVYLSLKPEDEASGSPLARVRWGRVGNFVE